MLGKDYISDLRDVGYVSLNVRTRFGTNMDANLQNVLQVPNLQKNLLSFTSILKNIFFVVFSPKELTCKLIEIGTIAGFSLLKDG